MKYEFVNKAWTPNGEVDTKVLEEKVKGVAYKAIIAENVNGMNK